MTEPSRHEQNGGARDEEDNGALSAETMIERANERGVWAGMLEQIGQSEAHVAEPQQMVDADAPVDVQQKATIKEMLISPAAAIDGCQWRLVVDVGNATAMPRPEHGIAA